MFISSPSSREAVRQPNYRKQTASPTIKQEPRFSDGDSYYKPSDFSEYHKLAAVEGYLGKERLMTVIRDVAPKTENPEVIERLAQELINQNKGVDATVFPSSGASLLHSAVARRRPYFVKILLSMGANPKAQDKEGKTALNWLEDRKKDIFSQDYEAIEGLLTNTEKIAKLRQERKNRSAGKSSSWLPNPFSFWGRKQNVAAAESVAEQPKSLLDLQPNVTPEHPEETKKIHYTDSGAQTKHSIANTINSEVQTDNTRLSPREKAMAELLAKMQQELEAKKKELDERAENTSSLEAQLADVQEKNKALQSQLTEAQEKNKASNEAQEKIKELQRQNNRLMDENKIWESGISRMKAELQDAGTKLKAAQDDRAETEQRLSEVQAASTKSEHDAKEQTKQLKEELEAKQQLVSRLGEVIRHKTQREKDREKIHNESRKNDQGKIQELERNLKQSKMTQEELTSQVDQAKQETQQARQESAEKTKQLEKSEEENRVLRAQVEGAEWMRRKAEDSATRQHEENIQLRQQREEEQKKTDNLKTRLKDKVAVISGKAAETQEQITDLQEKNNRSNQEANQLFKEMQASHSEMAQNIEQKSKAQEQKLRVALLREQAALIANQESQSRNGVLHENNQGLKAEINRLNDLKTVAEQSMQYSYHEWHAQQQERHFLEQARDAWQSTALQRNSELSKVQNELSEVKAKLADMHKNRDDRLIRVAQYLMELNSTTLQQGGPKELIKLIEDFHEILFQPGKELEEIRQEVMERFSDEEERIRQKMTPEVRSTLIKALNLAELQRPKSED
jgi:chromosome segregation ATPase